jgi:hypothetical protein
MKEMVLLLLLAKEVKNLSLRIDANNFMPGVVYNIIVHVGNWKKKKAC